MIEGVDYAFSRPSPAGLRDAGKRFAVRYGGPGTADKHLTAAEVRALHGAGLAIVANAEGTARGLAGGARIGAQWADLADAHFRALGLPNNRPIYLSADWDVQPGEWPAVRAALEAAGRLIGAGRVGLYGGRRAIEWGQRDRCAQWFWQTYAWSGTPTHWVPGCHLQQYRNGVTVAGGDCDLNRALTVDYGGWTPHMPRDYHPWPVPEIVGDRPDSLLLADIWTAVHLGRTAYSEEKGHLLRQLDRIEAKQTPVVLSEADLQALVSLLAPIIDQAVRAAVARLDIVVGPEG